MLALDSHRPYRALALLLPAVFCGCTTDRGLLLTEVGEGAVELYLDEPAGSELSLRDHVLTILYPVPDPADPTVTLIEKKQVLLTGTIDGGEFLVVWEDPAHTGRARRKSYTNYFGQSVSGLAVEPGSFGSVDNSIPYAFRVHAKRTFYIFPFFYRIEETDDVVSFGPPPRPGIGGSFSLTGALDGVQRLPGQGTARAQTVWRKVKDVNGVDVPKDGDTEDDWRQDDESFGTAK